VGESRTRSQKEETENLQDSGDKLKEIIPFSKKRGEMKGDGWSMAQNGTKVGKTPTSQVVL